MKKILALLLMIAILMTAMVGCVKKAPAAEAAAEAVVDEAATAVEGEVATDAAAVEGEAAVEAATEKAAQ
jgi:hypothetical protein